MIVLIGIVSIGTAVWGVPPSGNTAQPVNVGAGVQSKLGAFAVKTTNIVGTKFSVGGATQIKKGSSFINNPFIINGSAFVGNTNSQGRLFSLVQGGLTVTDANGDNLSGNENIMIEALSTGPQSPLCATQTGQLVRC